MAKSEYFRDRHLMAVQAAALTFGVSLPALGVLVCLCNASQFRAPTAYMSRETMAERLGCSVATIKRALAELRDAEVIEVVAYEKGGRGKSTIYKLTTKCAKRVSHEPEREKSAENVETGSNHDLNRVKSDTKPGHPRPSSYNLSHNLSQKDERRIAGRNAAPPSEGGLARDGSLTEQRQLVAAAMAAEGCDYGTARHLVAKGWRPVAA